MANMYSDKINNIIYVYEQEIHHTEGVWETTKIIIAGLTVALCFGIMVW